MKKGRNTLGSRRLRRGVRLQPQKRKLTDTKLLLRPAWLLQVPAVQPVLRGAGVGRNKNEEKVDGGFGGDTEDTQTMDQLIGELESSRSPRAKRKLEGVLEAQKYKAELGITTKQAVAKVQKLNSELKYIFFPIQVVLSPFHR